MSNACDRWQIVRYTTNQFSATERTAIEKHLRTCAECRTFLHECRTLQAAVKNRAQARVAHFPTLNLSQFKEKQIMITAQTMPKRTPARSLSAYISLFGLLTLIVGAAFLLWGKPFNGFIYQGATPTLAATNTATHIPSATPTAAPLPFTGFRGTIHMRFKLIIMTDGDKTPSEDWRLYLWNDVASKSSRWELYRTCKDQPIIPHDATTQSELEKVGARAFLNGPMFERCLKPWTIETHLGSTVHTINLRSGTPYVAAQDDPAVFRFIGGFTVGIPGYPPEMRSIVADPDFSELKRKLTEAHYENIQETGTEIIAGRKTIMFEMTSPPSKKPIPAGAVEEVKRTLWVDPETHLIMGSESLDKDGISILSWAFTDFELNPQFAPDLFTVVDTNQLTPTPTVAP